MKTGRKVTGGRYKKVKKKKATGRQKQARIVKLGERKSRLLIGRGKTKKIVLLSEQIANITSKGKAKQVKITKVLETPSNIFLARQNIIVKGSIIETELGKAIVTNRPSQEGMIQAKIIEE
jgi:small subunit ribosomal protein S8e